MLLICNLTKLVYSVIQDPELEKLHADRIAALKVGKEQTFFIQVIV